MKKFKLFVGALLLVSSFSLASCGFLTEDASDTNKTNDIDTSTKKEMKYEVGTATIDSWVDSINSTWIKIAVPVKNTGDVNIYLGDMSALVQNIEVQ